MRYHDLITGKSSRNSSAKKKKTQFQHNLYIKKVSVYNF